MPMPLKSIKTIKVKKFLIWKINFLRFSTSHIWWFQENSQSRSLWHRRWLGRWRRLKIFEAIRIRMSSNCPWTALSVCLCFTLGGRLAWALSNFSPNPSIQRYSKIFLGRPVCFFVIYASRSFKKFAITVLLRPMSLAMTLWDKICF